MGGVLSTSTQVGNQNLTQQFSGSCSITCDNTMTNSGVTAIGSTAGGDIGAWQTCSANGQCIISSSTTAVADLQFKAGNAASSDIFSSIFGSKSISYQEINQSIQQHVIESCKVSSTNDMNNVQVYSVGSAAGGNIGIGQSGSTTGNCVLNNIMNATAKASATTDNCAASGKNAKKKNCKGKGKGGIGSIILYGIVGMIAFTIIMMIVKFMKGPALPNCTVETPEGTKCKPGPTPCDKNTPKGTPCAPKPKSADTLKVDTPKNIDNPKAETPKVDTQEPSIERVKVQEMDTSSKKCIIPEGYVLIPEKYIPQVSNEEPKLSKSASKSSKNIKATDDDELGLFLQNEWPE